jgi:hypothetical protein
VKGLAIAAAFILASLLLAAASVFGLGDEQILTAPPEAVAEEFIRAVAHDRAGTARSLLARDAERAMEESEIHALSGRFRSRFGRLDRVDGSVAGRRSDSLIMSVRVQGERADGDVQLWLVREFGQWSVAKADQ